MTSIDVRAERVFHEVVETTGEERARLLERRCAGDAVLRGRVERLLEADACAPERFLVTEEEALEAAEGARIGEFEVLERLGEGGMGTVYAALQRSPRREVALKVIRTGRMTAEATARFQREIEVLGNLRHPGIAQIYQAGCTVIHDLAGADRPLPYFAMELVRGPSLMQYAQERGLDLRARLELFALVCDAVHHAHLQGVVHRDIKSENVLVTDEPTHAGPLGRGRLRIGQPKILDFGIARLIDDGEPRTRDTQVGDVIGTLTNISPEQLRGETERIDARTDVYSLGVLLYQLLAGRLPIDLTGQSVPQALRTLEGERPPPLGRLRPALRGDLTVIADKALERDAELRYPSAAALAEDVRRHLAGEPIRARAHSRLYVLWRAVQRNRVLALTTALIMALLCAFVLVYRRQAIDNRGLAEREAAARRRAEEALTASRIERGRLLGRTGNAAGEQLLWTEFLAEPDSLAAHWALREFYATHPCLASRHLHEGKVRAVAVQADGSMLASVADDDLVRITDPRTLQDLCTPIESPTRLFSLAFRPGSSELVAGTEEGELLLWDVADGRLLRRWGGPRGAVRCLAFDPDGELLVSGGDGGVCLWSPEGELLREVEEAGRVVYRAEFSPDGGGLALACSRGLWLLEDALTSAPRRLEAHVRTVNGVAFGATEDVLYSSGPDGRLFEWDLASDGEPRLILDGDRPRSIRGGPREGELVVLHAGRVDRVATRDGTLLQSLPLGDFAWALDVDGERLVVGDRQGRLRWWSLAPPWPAALAFEESVVAAYSPDGTRLLTGDARGRLQSHAIVPPQPGRRRSLGALEGERLGEGPVTWVAVDDDGRWLWSNAQGTLRAWEPGDAEPRCLAQGVLGRRAPVFDLAPGGGLLALALAGEERGFRVLSLPEGEELVTFPTEGDEAYAVGWSPDGRWLATLARNEEQVMLRSFAAGGDPSRPAATRRLGRPGERPLSFAFSADGARLLVGTWERSIQVWDVATGTLVAELRGHEGSVWDVALLAGDPSVFASLGADGTVRLWSLAPPRELATFTVEATTRRGFLSTRPHAPLAVAGGGATLRLFDLDALEDHIAGNREFARRSFVAPER